MFRVTYLDGTEELIVPGDLSIERKTWHVERSTPVEQGRGAVMVLGVADGIIGDDGLAGPKRVGREVLEADARSVQRVVPDMMRDGWVGFLLMLANPATAQEMVAAMAATHAGRMELAAQELDELARTLAVAVLARETLGAMGLDSDGEAIANGTMRAGAGMASVDAAADRARA
jgi:hypothetical protein